MAAGNRKSSNKRKTQTKKERMAEMEKAQAFRVEVTLWIVVAAALLLFISNLGFGGAVGKTVSGFLFGLIDFSLVTDKYEFLHIRDYVRDQLDIFP